MIYCFKMAAKLPIFALRHFDFPKKFFNEIWLIIGDYQYLNITEIKARKQRVSIFFFFLRQKKRINEVDNCKKHLTKIDAIVVKYVKNSCRAP